MGSMSNVLEAKVLNHLFKGTALSQPTNLYAGLATAAISDSSTLGSITEVSGGSYARVNVNAKFGTPASGGGSISNDAEIAFPQATVSWGTVTYWFITDGTDIWWWGILTDAQVVAIGNTFKFPAGSVVFTLD